EAERRLPGLHEAARQGALQAAVLRSLRLTHLGARGRGRRRGARRRGGRGGGGV
ncbi:hypothetical protein MNEG_10444, partial [Monoraphidium neglectum]